jgi:hypothetical protein
LLVRERNTNTFNSLLADLGGGSNEHCSSPRYGTGRFESRHSAGKHPIVERRYRDRERFGKDHHYYTFSSVAYYTGEQELLLNGRWNNFEYGSNAPDVPDVFLDDEKLKVLWNSSQRYYLVAKADQVKRFDRLLGPENFEILTTSGGKILMTNQVIDRKL